MNQWLVYPNGDRYFGEVCYFQERIFPHGNGTYWSGGGVYSGQCWMGWWHGRGRLTEHSTNGVTTFYDGQWQTGTLVQMETVHLQIIAPNAPFIGYLSALKGVKRM